MSAVQEDEGTKEAKNQQLLAEDIDSILARAEVKYPLPRILHLIPCLQCSIKQLTML